MEDVVETSEFDDSDADRPNPISAISNALNDASRSSAGDFLVSLSSCDIFGVEWVEAEGDS